MPQVISIQSGSATLSASSGNITITSVNTDTSFLLVSFSCEASNAVSALLSATLSSATNIAWYRQGSSTGYLHWWVIEFDSSVSVQRGRQSVAGAATTSITISAVTLADAFATGGRDGDSFSPSTADVCQFKLTTTTNLDITHHASPSTTENAAWQVVECADFSVQSGTIDLSSATSNTATISTVDTGQTFVLCSQKSNLTAGDILYLYSRCYLTNSTTITATVNTSGYSHEAHYYAVDVIDADTVVQYGSVNIASSAGDKTENVTVTGVDTNLSVAFLSGAYMMGGETANTDDRYSDALLRVNLTSSTNLELFSDLKATTSDFSWFVLEFAEYAAGAQTGDITAQGKAGGGFTAFAQSLGALFQAATAEYAYIGGATANGGVVDVATAGQSIEASAITQAMASAIVLAIDAQGGQAVAIGGVTGSAVSGATQSGQAATGGTIDDSATADQEGQGGAATGGAVSIQALSADLQAALSQAVAAIDEGVSGGEAWAGGAISAAQILEDAITRTRFQQLTVGPQFDDTEDNAIASETQAGEAATAASISGASIGGASAEAMASSTTEIGDASTASEAMAAASAAVASILDDAVAGQIVVAVADVRATIPGDSLAGKKFEAAAGAVADLIAGAESLAIVTAITQARAALSAKATAGAIFTATVSYVSTDIYSLLATVTIYAAIEGATKIYPSLLGDPAAYPDINGDVKLH